LNGSMSTTPKSKTKYDTRDPRGWHFLSYSVPGEAGTGVYSLPLSASLFYLPP
jgi:hypothetical protein